MIAARGGEEAGAIDQATFVALVEPVLPAAYRLAVAMLRSEIEAEDAVQEAVFSAWRHHSRFKPGSEMKPWLLAIVANECRGMRRTVHSPRQRQLEVHARRAAGSWPGPG